MFNLFGAIGETMGIFGRHRYTSACAVWSEIYGARLNNQAYDKTLTGTQFCVFFFVERGHNMRFGP